MAYESFTFEQDERVGTLTFNRPNERNALNHAARSELSSILTAVEDSSNIGVLVIRGAGTEHFTSGDIEDLKRLDSLELYEFIDTLGQRLYSRIDQLDIPVIASINGLCIGAGLEIALTCDLRIAADHVRMGLPEVLLGAMPAGGATQRLTRLIGPGRAKELLFTGEFIDAKTALAMGLVNRVVPTGELDQVTHEFARKLSQKSAVALKLLKRAVNMAQETTMSAALSFEALAAVANWNCPDCKEGIDAFLGRRQPQFNTRETKKTKHKPSTDPR